MRLREVRKGMKVRVKKIIKAKDNDDSETMKKFIGKPGKVVHVYMCNTYDNSYRISVSFGRGTVNNFDHKELEQVK